MDLTDIIRPHKSWQHAWTFHSEMIVEHLYLDVSPGDGVITVSDGIYDQFNKTQGVLGWYQSARFYREKCAP